jgi:hypothetical protein
MKAYPMGLRTRVLPACDKGMGTAPRRLRRYAHLKGAPPGVGRHMPFPAVAFRGPAKAAPSAPSAATPPLLPSTTYWPN